MAYIPTDWVDDETLVNAARMDNIEAGIVNLETNKSEITHNHDDVYSKLNHTHQQYAEKTDVYNRTYLDSALNSINVDIDDLQDNDVIQDSNIDTLQSQYVNLNGRVTTNTHSIANT